jgi:transmembrane sensor
MIEADSQEAELAPLDREAHAWVRRLTSGDATTADAEAFAEWRDFSTAHKAAFARASRLWNAFGPAGQRLRAGHVPVAGAVTGPAMWTPARRFNRRIVLGGAIAASAAAGAVIVQSPLELWPSLSELTADYRTATGEQRRIAVADGVSIAMNTQTSIALRSAALDADRIELIAGEAAITLARDGSRSLVVEAAGGSAIASNANFGMRLHGRVGLVTCLDGEIRVRCLGREIAIRRRQRIAYDERGLGEIEGIDPVLASAWQDGLLIFRSTPLHEVIEEINRYRSGRIVLLNAELGRRSVNGRFRIDRTDDVLVQIQQAFGARQRVLPGGIVLLS